MSATIRGARFRRSGHKEFEGESLGYSPGRDSEQSLLKALSMDIDTGHFFVTQPNSTQNGQTDRLTDGIAVAGTALVMRRAVKTVSSKVVAQSIAFRVVSIY